LASNGAGSNDAVRAKPDRLRYNQRPMSIERGTLLFQTGRYAEAEQQYRAALVAEPDNALGHAMVALCLLQSKTFADAEAEARQAVALRPDWYLGYSVLASVLSDREQLKPAAESITKAIELNPFEPHLQSTLAFIRMKQRDWPRALAAADAGLESDPEHAGCLNARGMALVNLGRRGEAGQTLQGALDRNPHNAMTHANQGWAMLHAGRHKEALVHFREALRIDPNLQWAKSGTVEALKARNILYRWVLRYFLFMSRKSRGVQIGVVIGAYLGEQILVSAGETHPAIRPYVLPIEIAYIVLALSTWLAAPLSNLLLRLNRFGRHALSRDQTVSSNWIGGLLLAGAVVSSVWVFRHDLAYLMAGVMIALLALPTSAVFGCSPGWPRWTMVGYTIVVAAAVTICVASGFVQLLPDAELSAALFQGSLKVFEFGVIGSAFAANALMTARVRR
jgi:tetratricopeptide (TPR) repeat protein